jgi:hypothetical protein
MRYPGSRKVSVLAFGLALAWLVGAIETNPSSGQAPPWPQTQGPMANMECRTTGVTCAVCAPGVNIGCSAGIPWQWTTGQCAQVLGPNCTHSTFACGPQYLCATGQPNGGTCPAPIICQ